MVDSLEILGSIFVGDILNIFLFGGLAVQFFTYLIHSYERDFALVKTVVIIIMLLETAQSILLLYDAFLLFCLRWGIEAALVGTRLRWLSIPVLGSLISFLVQVFYAWRIWTFTRRNLVVALILALSLTTLGAGLAVGLSTGIHNIPISQLDTTFKPAAVWLTGTAVTDCLITTLLVRTLAHSRREIRASPIDGPVDGPKTSHILTRVIRINLETGLASALFAVVSLILFLIMPQSPWHLIPASILSKLSGSCLFVVLNSRSRMTKSHYSSHSTPHPDVYVTGITHSRGSGSMHWASTSISAGTTALDELTMEMAHIDRTSSIGYKKDATRFPSPV
ncbi:hypothetical protein DL96DRAFT_811501 [Flagelloscypha sp. PMI_526]|nr:hypothetical protein DL96DRAFT_811501 [Flagelloscypha sp. PMI_526]